MKKPPSMIEDIYISAEEKKQLSTDLMEYESTLNTKQAENLARFIHKQLKEAYKRGSHNGFERGFESGRSGRVK